MEMLKSPEATFFIAANNRSIGLVKLLENNMATMNANVKKIEAKSIER